MGLIKGGFLRLFQTALYFLELCCAAGILGIFSYFLAVETKHNLGVPVWERAVEGLSGAACLYLLFAVLLTCCLAGITFFSFVGLILDVLFIGAFVAMAVLTRYGASSCRGTVNTPVGTGLGTDGVPGSLSYHTACKLNTAAFSLSVIGAFLFLITALMQIALWRNHKKEKMQGPGPDNDYTSGAGKKSRFSRKKNLDNEKHDAELGAAIPATTLVADRNTRDLRPSHDTAYTGSTVAAPNAPTATQYKDTDAGGFHNGHAPHVAGYQPHQGGYYTAPTTTNGTARNVERNAEPTLPTIAQGTTTMTSGGVAGGNHLNFNPPPNNPYGYDNTTTGTARNF